jgi:hypothetical protein
VCRERRQGTFNEMQRFGCSPTLVA